MLTQVKLYNGLKVLSKLRMIWLEIHGKNRKLVMIHAYIMRKKELLL